MNPNLEIQPEMLERLSIAKENGCEAAADVLQLFESENLPQYLYGSWWTRRVRNYRNTLKDIKFVQRQKGSNELKVLSSSEFIDLIIGIFNSGFVDKSAYAYAKGNPDYESDFVAMIIPNTKMRILVTKSRKKIENYLNKNNWAEVQDLSVSSFWESATQLRYRYSEIGADFLTQVVQDFRMVFVLDNEGKTLGFSIIYDNAMLINPDDTSGTTTQTKIALASEPIAACAGARLFINKYLLEHYDELKVDVQFAYYVHTSINPAFVDKTTVSAYSQVPLHIAPTYKGGMPPSSFLLRLCKVAIIDNALWLTSLQSSEVLGAPGSATPKIESWNFARCQCCGEYVYSKDGCCKKCMSRDKEETLFGPIIKALPKLVKHWGQVPSSFLDEHGKLQPWATTLLMFKKFTDDYI